MVLIGSGILLLPIAEPAISVAAPDSTPTPVFTPHPNLSSMLFFVGTWSCTEDVNGKRLSHAAAATISLGGAWIVTENTASAVDRRRPFSFDYMTYDDSIKR